MKREQTVFEWLRLLVQMHKKTSPSLCSHYRWICYIQSLWIIVYVNTKKMEWKED